MPATNGTLARPASLGFHLGDHQAVRAARHAHAGQAFVLHHLDAERGPRAGAGLERDGVGFVVGIGPLATIRPLPGCAVGGQVPPS